MVRLRAPQAWDYHITIMWCLLVHLTLEALCLVSIGGASKADAHRVQTNRTYYPQCAGVTPKLFNASTTWGFIRRSYDQIIREQGLHDRFALDMPEYAKNPMPLADRPHGFKVPYEVRLNERTGQRGVFATKRIPRGTLVWSSIQSVEFRSRDELLRLLYAVGRELACDLVRFSYNLGNGQIGLDLDDGAFFNTEHRKSNIACRPPEEIERGEKGCTLHNYAQRDCAAGDELFDDYTRCYP